MSDDFLIDRTPAIELFRAMLDRVQHTRILRLTGTEKMGKSRVLREYRCIAAQEYRAQCALVDLRSRLQTPSDLLYTISQQIGIAYFPGYQVVRDELSRQPRLKISRVNQLFSILSARTEQDSETAEHQRRRLTATFLQDLQAMPNNLLIVLLFDAFEEADEAIQAWLNEQLLLGLCQLPHVRTVLAGRSLPEPVTTWQDTCNSYDLPPVSLEDYREYCTKTGIEAGDETIQALHKVFDGKPGFFVECAPKLRVRA